MNTIATPRIRAGALPPVDQRPMCRNDREAAEWLTHTHRVIHTKTPQERDHDASLAEDALICGVVAFICIAAPLAAFLLTR